ncbi:MAG: IS200/IS605 family accessory protein TnpB-related protein [Selenomonadaceae bacterium]|nr:IS200/IS605 family accessory protein TnpB-related protein [Selenomonadaceae bacterium]
MLQKTNAQIQDLNHKITRAFVKWVLENKISKVYVGNPEGVQRKKKGKKVNQKLSRWNFGVHLKYLEYKLAEVGIKLEKNNEAYSTQTCPQYGRRHKCSGRNRDVHGARNILSLGLNQRICITTKIKETKYLRTA